MRGRMSLWLSDPKVQETLIELIVSAAFVGLLAWAAIYRLDH